MFRSVKIAVGQVAVSRFDPGTDLKLGSYEYTVVPLWNQLLTEGEITAKMRVDSSIRRVFSSPWVSGPPLIDVSFRQNGRGPVAVPVWRRDRPEIGFVPSKRQLVGCRSRLEPGKDPKLGSFRQNSKIPDLNWEAEILGAGANWGFIEFSLRAEKRSGNR